MLSIPFSFQQSTLDLIRARTSVRRFTGKILSGRVREEMDRCCKTLTVGPLGSSCRFQLVDNDLQGKDRGDRVGAYGMIWGARIYLAGAVENNRYALEDFGYLFELLVLKATDLELGTCWLGGNFTRDRFANAIGLREEEILPAVSPVGVPTKRRSILDQVIRWGAGAKQRKSWPDLFFDNESKTPLSEERAGVFSTALEMLRLAPSASNRQPWRCVRQEGFIHLYLQRFPGYRSLTPTDLQRVDMGIAMSHFDLAAAASGLGGGWTVVNQPPVDLPDAWQKAEYVVSWRPEDGSAN
jgi:nitroreductase